MRKRLYIFILMCWLAGVFTLMLNPLPPVPDAIKRITYYDKAAHFVFFGISTYLLIAIGLRLKRFKFIHIAIVAVIISASFAQLGEHLQNFIPGRESSWLDFIAGFLGMIVACPISYLIHHSPKRKLLLHVCCAPCATAVQEILANGYKVDFFFFNPNIYPAEEYQKRFKEVKKLAKHFGVRVFEKKYDYENWKQSIIGYENEPEGGLRCDLCFRHRLKEAAKAADKKNYSFFATTLTISPHKKSQKVNSIGNRLGRISGTPFLDQDFKDGGGFARSVEISEELGLYRQNYCGCEYSIRKRIKI
jgi:predicted adenine nucleotide alpha hydrolase (AANH) superfamily ATPase/VanZ family protein